MSLEVDGTLNLILRARKNRSFKQKIADRIATFTHTNKQLQGKINSLTGKMGLNKMEYFQEKVEVYKTIFPDAIVLATYFSLGGFTDEAGDFCLEYEIGVADKIEEL